MRKALVVASREVRERWLLLAAGLALGGVSLAFPALARHPRWGDLAGALGAGSLAVAAGLLTGSSMLARDAAEGRLAFLLARPVSWFHVWVGKWMAALALVLGSGLLVGLPWILLRSRGPAVARLWRDPSPETGLALAIGAVLLIGGVNLLSTVYRARSWWLALDLALAMAALWAAARYLEPLAFHGFVGRRGGWALLAAVALILLAASGAQTAFGRTDLPRAHHALSATFWSGTAVVLLAAASWVAWIEAAGPADLRRVVQASRSADGRWLAVYGETNRGGHYGAAFLIDTTSGGFVPSTAIAGTRALLHGVPPWASLPSLDERMAWRLAPFEGGTALEQLDLTASPPRRGRIPLEASSPIGWWSSADLSGSGTTVLVTGDSTASLFSLPTGRALATAQLPPGWQVATARFRGDVARVYAMAARFGQPPSDSPSEVRVIDLAPDGAHPAGRFTATTRLRLSGDLEPDGRGDRLVTSDGALRLRDGATGDLLATLFEGATASARFLGDGRIAATRVEAERQKLLVFDAAGAPMRSVDLGVARGTPLLGPDAGPRRLVVHASDGFVRPRCWIVDLESGQVELFEGLIPAPASWRGSRQLAHPALAPGLFVDEQGRLLNLDDSGRRTVLVGTGAPRGHRLTRF